MAESGESVVCLVPYIERTTGFEDGTRIRVLTALGWATATVEGNTNVNTYDWVEQELAQEAGFETGIKAAEKHGQKPESSVAIVRFRIDQILTEETGLQRARRVISQSIQRVTDLLP